MLAPPPGGTFDVDDSSLPLRNPLKDGAEVTKDSPVEKVPLLTQDAHPNSNPNQVKKGKVRIYMYSLFCIISSEYYISDCADPLIGDKKIARLSSNNRYPRFVRPTSKSELRSPRRVSQI